MRREPLEIAFGPMFACEWRIAARRWQLHILRAAFVAILLAAIWFAWYSTVNRFGGRSPMRMLADLGESIFYAFAAVQLALVMVVAPGTTAGAVCLDRARGTLLHLMVTDLTDREIVLGKIGARLMWMLGLILAALPVMALMTLLGGIDPRQLAGAFAVTVGIAVLGCSLALLLSVWASKAHEVVMAVYLVWIGWLLAWPLTLLIHQALVGFINLNGSWIGPNGWMARSNPFWVLFGATNPGSAIGLADQLLFGAGTVAASAVLIGLAVWRMRPAAMSAGSRPLLRLPRLHLDLGRFLPGPSLDFNPVLWREWHRNRPSRWARALWWTYGLAAAAFTFWTLSGYYGRRPFDLPAVANVVQVGVGLLLLSVSAATPLAEERVRGSLDVLMTTPLSTSSIVLGKWLGGYHRVPWLAALPALIALACVIRTGHWYGALLIVVSVLIEGALIVSLGLWFATLTPKLGRAIGFSVAAYVLMAIGWVFVVVLLFPRGPRGAAQLLVAFSPLFNMGQLTDSVARDGFGPERFEIQVYATIWAIVKAGLAGFFYAITLFGFERRLGRITMTRDPHASLPFVPGKKTADELLIAPSEALL